MTNFQHFMGPLNKWGFVQAIAHTKGNLLPQNIVDSTLLEHVHENEESFFSLIVQNIWTENLADREQQ